MPAVQPFRWAAVVVIFALIGAMLAGGTAQAVQDEPVPVPMTESSTKLDQMAIHVVSAKTGEPQANVQLQFTGRIGIRNANRTLKTDAEGNTELAWPSGQTIPNLRFTTRKPGFVPANYQWQGNQAPVLLPKELELKLEPSTKLAGIIVDEQQKPIVGAQVRLSMPITWPQTDSTYFTIATLTSDRQGHWQFDDAPSDVSRLNVSVTHPEYRSPGTRVAPGTENVFVLKQGPALRGLVVDSDGKPVGFARVRFGENRFSSNRAETVTDAEGLFELKNCEAGASYVTVQDDTHAPQMQRVVVGAQNDPLKFTVESGHVLRGRVVDVDGKPISGVGVSPEYWQGMQILDNRMTTDAEGRFAWKAAPADGVKYSIYHQGNMSLRDLPLIANGEEQVVTMHPELIVSGNVTDAVSGEPIKNFQLQRGQSQGIGQAYWYQDENNTFTGGTYTFRFSEPSQGLMLRAHADGYLPADSRVLRATEGKVTFNFSLKPGKGPGGLVLLPSGEPAVGAEIGLWRQSTYIQIEQGRFGRNRQTQIVTTDKEGRFSLPPQNETDPFLLIVLHDAGYADVTSVELAKSERIMLAGWGKLEGQVFDGAKPDANRIVSYNPQRQADQNDAIRRNFYGYNYQATTDGEGRFSFDRVVPGKGLVSRMTVTRWENSSMHSPGWTQSLDIKSGESTKVKIGGTGRPVVGKVTTDREPDVPINWAGNDPASITPRAPQRTLLGSIFGQSGPAIDPNLRYLGAIDETGKFSIPDVPAGDYTLLININEPPSSNGFRQGIGSTSANFTVPAMEGGRSDERLDLGVVTAKLLEVLEPGKVAPAATIPSLDGKTIRMADFAGKLVLVSFLSADRGGDLSRVATLKKVYDQFGKDPNFVMLTVWCGSETANIKQGIEANGVKGLHGIVPNLYTRVPQSYLVRTLPTTFLIGANGKVISRNAKEDELKKSIDSFLSLGELYFMTEKPEKTSAFPLKRFDVGEAKLTAAPAVVVADDTDPNFDQAAPRDDRVRILAADGKELLSQGGFNNAQTVGAVHGVAIDRRRGRFYVREDVAHRLTAFSASGQKLWQVEQIDAETVAVDERTGNIWVSGGPSLNEGETIVLDSEGKDVTILPLRGIDIVYDPHDDAFWLVGYEIIKVNRSGEVRFRNKIAGWCCPSAAVNPADGSMWIVERKHPDAGNSKDRLWLLNADGSTRLEIDLGEHGASAVALAGKDGGAWISGYGIGLRHVSVEGQLGQPLPIEARAIAVSPTSGDIWVTTKDAVLKIDETGRELAKSPFRAESQQAWIAAF